MYEFSSGADIEKNIDLKKNSINIYLMVSKKMSRTPIK